MNRTNQTNDQRMSLNPTRDSAVTPNRRANRTAASTPGRGIPAQLSTRPCSSHPPCARSGSRLSPQPAQMPGRVEPRCRDHLDLDRDDPMASSPAIRSTSCSPSRSRRRYSLGYGKPAATRRAAVRTRRCRAAARTEWPATRARILRACSPNTASCSRMANSSQRGDVVDLVGHVRRRQKGPSQRSLRHQRHKHAVCVLGENGLVSDALLRAGLVCRRHLATSREESPNVVHGLEQPGNTDRRKGAHQHGAFHDAPDLLLNGGMVAAYRRTTTRRVPSRKSLANWTSPRRSCPDAR